LTLFPGLGVVFGRQREVRRTESALIGSGYSVRIYTVF
jgi:hypothetical protein